jgi:signal transduction histidine kinase
VSHHQRRKSFAVEKLKKLEKRIVDDMQQEKVNSINRKYVDVLDQSIVGDRMRVQSDILNGKFKLRINPRLPENVKIE